MGKVFPDPMSMDDISVIEDEDCPDFPLFRHNQALRSCMRIPSPARSECLNLVSAFPPHYHAVECCLTHNENSPILLPTKREFLSIMTAEGHL